MGKVNQKSTKINKKKKDFIRNQEKISAYNFALSDAENNTLEPSNRGGIKD